MRQSSAPPSGNRVVLQKKEISVVTSTIQTICVIHYVYAN